MIKNKDKFGKIFGKLGKIDSAGVLVLSKSEFLKKLLHFAVKGKGEELVAGLERCWEVLWLQVVGKEMGLEEVGLEVATNWLFGEE